jgi:hypothetical protein
MAAKRSAKRGSSANRSVAAKKASSLEFRIFTALSKSDHASFVAAKSEMSEMYLKAEAAPFAVHAFRASARSAKTENVLGVGIDEKYVDGIPTGVKAIKFLVRSKMPPSAVLKSHMLPSSISGLATDVEEVGNIVPYAKRRGTGRVRATATAAAKSIPNPKMKFRPAQPGSSIGFEDPAKGFVMAGTFGLVVKDSAGVKYVLSNNHVLAYESGILANGNTRVGLPPGSPIFQPGLLDGGNAATDQIAELTRWVDLHADNSSTTVDAAIAKLVPQNIAIADVLFIGAPAGTAHAAVDMVVQKFGRTTSYRAGRVTSVSFDVNLRYEVGNVVLHDQIAIRGLNGKPFSAAGDSGSAILERTTNNVIGLLFAGATNNSVTFANHIEDVLQQLSVQLV